MAAAVAVVAGMGQPRPAAPASGTSVPVRAAHAAPVQMDRVLVVSRGVVARYDPTTGRAWLLSLPPGMHARSAVGLAGGGIVVIATDRSGRARAYFARAGTLTPLGPGELVVRAADRRSAWIIYRGQARQVDAFGHTGTQRLVIPTGCVPVGANAWGLIVTGASDLLPGHVWVLVADRAPHLLVAGRALAVSAHRVLVARGSRLSLVGMDRRLVARLPWPSALVASGPGSISSDGRTYALIARTADRERLVVGQMLGQQRGQTLPSPHVVPLDGGSYRASPPPVWVAAGTVLAVRPDGRLVAYLRGRPHGWLLAAGPTAVVSLAGS